MLNLNSYLISNDSPMVKNYGLQPDYFNPGIEVELKQATSSKVAIKELIKITSFGSATADFSSSQSLTLTSTLTYNNPYSQSVIFGHPYVAVYQGAGTALANQIFPAIGTSVTLGRYVVQSEFDLVGWDTISSRWRALINDTNGTSTQVITFAARWAYIDQKVSNAS